MEEEEEEEGSPSAAAAVAPGCRAFLATSAESTAGLPTSLGGESSSTVAAVAGSQVTLGHFEGKRLDSPRRWQERRHHRW